jgi:hypothetical protein
MTRSRALVLAAIAVFFAGPLVAQERPAPRSAGWIRPVAHYGKWLTAGAAAAFTVFAAREHSRSADAWDALLAICRQDNADCALGSDGRYANTVAEAHYQQSLYYDARARRRLIVGQTALVLSVAMFVFDLRRGNGPPNIPFDPDKLIVTPARNGGALVGLRLRW